LPKVDAFQLGSNNRSQVLDPTGSCEKIRLGWIRVQTAVFDVVLGQRFPINIRKVWLKGGQEKLILRGVRVYLELRMWIIIVSIVPDRRRVKRVYELTRF
jgi:hypothetical protein